MCRRIGRGEGLTGERQIRARPRGLSTTGRQKRGERRGWIRAVYSGSIHPTVEAERAAL